MTLPHSLTGLINSTRDTISKEDAPAFLKGLLALTPLPEGKTVDKLTRYVIQPRPDGTISVSTNYKQ